MITRKERIAVIKQDEKTLYDYRRYHPVWDERIGLAQAAYLLFRKRKRLEAKLKK